MTNPSTKRALFRVGVVVLAIGIWQSITGHHMIGGPLIIAGILLVCLSSVRDQEDAEATRKILVNIALIVLLMIAFAGGVHLFTLIGGSDWVFYAMIFTLFAGAVWLGGISTVLIIFRAHKKRKARRLREAE